MSTRALRPKTAPVLGAVLVIVATAGAAAIGLIAGQGGGGPDTAAAGVGAESPAALAWGRGACVDRQDARFDLVPCAAADGRVISVVGARAPECPAETDELVMISGAPAAPGTAGEPGEVAPQSLRAGRTACVRSLRGPHAGDPGRGGGVLRPGDCLALRGGELPCSARGWYGRVLAVVGAKETCPSGALDALAVGGRAVVCLGEGGGVLSVGDCVVRPGERLVSRRALTRAPCGSPEAWARVTARAGSNDGCPAGSDRYLRVRGPGIPRPVTCLRRVALHGSP
ncbi:hypothetical protein HS048_00045 [Planomonospora sp. ID91781]|uniref:LppU/SCO3897 family protein n=1 Tax=Planomonospora sp. ID91781 TaxID=2738135 RepID=UPI0018C3BCD2|nr:hypothetical protein [Planomonospora sp. ID91781]MBG0819159.1 hypothetical protein [Planomonospora sp. ID91781]